MIIIGLGNPGVKYEQTRHNLGFVVLDKLAAATHATPWKKERRVLVASVGQHLLIKPQDFMNMSGPSIKDYLDYKKISWPAPPDVVVVQDELDFPLGEVHHQVNRSAAGHNGVASIIEAFGTQNFSRLRIGIGNNRDTDIPAEEYVLQKFSSAEQKIIGGAVEQAVELLNKKLG